MKTFLLTLLTATVGLLSLQAQTTEFAPIGARWIRSDISWNVPITEVSTVIGDTLIEGNICRVIQVDEHLLDLIDSLQEHNYNVRREYVYSQGDQVYYYRDGAFYTLYNFAAQVGDTWAVKPKLVIDEDMGTIQVDSIGTEIVDGLLLRYLWVSPAPESCYGFFYYNNTKIIERIGVVQSGAMFPDYGVNSCTVIDGYSGATTFSCYQDPLLFVGEGDSCVYSVGTQTPVVPQRVFACYYNAQTAQLNLQVPEAIWVGGFTLYDLQGRVAAAQSLAPHQAGYQIDISLLPSGIYAYVFTDCSGAAVQRGKVVVVR